MSVSIYNYNSVIPEKSLFSAQRKNVILSGIPFGFAFREKQMGFRINFLSPAAKRKFCGMTQVFVAQNFRMKL
jgi:hypothetical protein